MNQLGLLALDSHNHIDLFYFIFISVPSSDVDVSLLGVKSADTTLLQHYTTLNAYTQLINVWDGFCRIIHVSFFGNYEKIMAFLWQPSPCDGWKALSYELDYDYGQSVPWTFRNQNVPYLNLSFRANIWSFQNPRDGHFVPLIGIFVPWSNSRTRFLHWSILYQIFKNFRILSELVVWYQTHFYILVSFSFFYHSFNPPWVGPSYPLVIVIYIYSVLRVYRLEPYFLSKF